MNPASIVRRVAKILHTISGELSFFARLQFADPEIPVFYISGAFAVRRDDLFAAGPTSAAPAAGIIYSDADGSGVVSDLTRAVRGVDEYIFASGRGKNAIPKSAVR